MLVSESCSRQVTLSLGGGTGQVGFKNDSQADEFAQKIWDMFLGKSPVKLLIN